MTFKEFMKEMLIYYRVELNPGVDEKAFTAALAKRFGETDPAIMARACEDIIRTRKTPFFPLPAEIEEAIEQAKRNINSDASRAGFTKQIEEMRGPPCDHDWVDFGASIPACRKCGALPEIAKPR